MIEIPGISIVIGFLLFAVVIAIVLGVGFFVIRRLIRSEVRRAQEIQDASNPPSR